MVYFDCNHCNTKVVIGKLSSQIDNAKQYTFCDNCIKTQAFCSKSKCRLIFLLNDDDMKNLKYLYINNKNNKSQFYLYKDIEQVVLNKYGSFDKLNEMYEQKVDVKGKKDGKGLTAEHKRKQELISALNQNKLEFQNHGDCYSYVKYGTPDIETVIQNMLVKLKRVSERRIELAKLLSDNGVPFNEEFGPCYNYIHDIGYKNLAETVQDAEIDHFLRTNTNYVSLLKKYNREVASEVALRTYFAENQEGNHTVPKIANSKRKDQRLIQFD